MNDSPSKRYADLPEHVRTFLEHLTEEEVEQLGSDIRWMRNTLVVLQFFKWIVGAIIVAFTTMVALGDSFVKICKWK